jgi:hypothetical protein
MVDDPKSARDSESISGLMGMLKSRHFLFRNSDLVNCTFITRFTIYFSFQNMVIKRPATYLLILTAHLLFTWTQSVEAVAISQPERTTENFLAPLSDEFINYINSLQTTWKVMYQEGCFVLRFVF